MTDNKLQNERKLLKNLDNIIKNYIKIDDKLIESIASDDDIAFKEQAINNSDDHFLDGIMDNYQSFSDALKDRLKELHKHEVDKVIQRRKDEQKTLTTKTVKPRNYGVSRKPKTTRQQPIRYSNQEKKIINRSKKNGYKPKKTTQKVNAYRKSVGLPERSYASVKSKYYRVKT